MDSITACCFFGHRTINASPELRDKLHQIIENLIVTKGVSCFLFGSKSAFDKLCLSVVTELKQKYPNIRRIYVRAEFPYIDKCYEAYLHQFYEESYYFSTLLHAGKAVYLERNYSMIDHSTYCVVYYDPDYQPPKRKQSKYDAVSYRPNSGTKLAYSYALSKNRQIVNVCELCAPWI